MTILLVRRADITLEAFERVAWRGETVELGAAALATMDRAHESFERMIAERLAADPAAQIYAITFGPGDAGPVDREHDTRPKTPWTGASFGQALPARVVRGIVLARLANFLEGHTAARGQVAAAVAALLQPDARVPAVPLQGTGGAGEILPLGHLFYELGGLKLEPKESMALINGSPCAAALVADVALAARGRTALAESVFALSVEALLSPVDRYATVNFSTHMLQHLLLVMGAAPLFALGAPITLALRAARPGTRKNVLLPILRSRPVSLLTHPIVAWLLFAVVMYASHFSGLYNLALAHEWVHAGEHLLYLLTGVLFWWPVVGLDPAPHKLSHPARLLYLVAAMPLEAFLAVALLSARPYPAYTPNRSARSTRAPTLRFTTVAPPASRVATTPSGSIWDSCPPRTVQPMTRSGHLAR